MVNIKATPTTTPIVTPTMSGVLDDEELVIGDETDSIVVSGATMTVPPSEMASAGRAVSSKLTSCWLTVSGNCR